VSAIAFIAWAAFCAALHVYVIYRVRQAASRGPQLARVTSGCIGALVLGVVPFIVAVALQPDSSMANLLITLAILLGVFTGFLAGTRAGDLLWQAQRRRGE
jgi:hypothetical protein